MNVPTAFEQSLLEMINRARANPQGEFDHLIADAATQTAMDPAVTAAIRFFDVDMEVLAAQLADLPDAAPLAWNFELAAAADTHSASLIEHDVQAHAIEGEPGLLQRVQDAGYTPMFLAENVFAYSKSDVFTHAGFYIDWGFTETGIQTGAGHRGNILDPGARDVGIAVHAEDDPQTQVGPYVVTQNFGTSWTPETFLLGVVTDDVDGDGLYDIGEGLGGITVTLSAPGQPERITTTWGSGGYQIAVEPGTFEVTFTGGALLDDAIVKTVEVGQDNVKLDAELREAQSPATVNLAPVLSVSASLIAVPENTGGIVATFSATDPEGDPITVLLDGPDAGLLFLSGNELHLAAPMDYEAPKDGNGDNILIVTLTAVDAHGNTVSRDVQLGITDVPDTPEPDTPEGGSQDPQAADSSSTGDGAKQDAPQDGADPTEAEPTNSDTGSQDPPTETSQEAGEAPPTLLQTGTEGSDSLVGTVGHDTIHALQGDDSVDGGGGNDLMAGADGDDTLLGGDGNDTIGGGIGNDRIDGGAGNDVVGAGQGNDSVFGAAGHDTLNGGAGDDTIFGNGGDDVSGAGLDHDSVSGGSGNDSLGGGAGRDTLHGDGGHDTIGGGEGDDVITGGAGADFLAGGGRHDMLDGGSGNDRINGGGGHDTLTGGTGADLFIFNAFSHGEIDVITDFTRGEDILRLAGIVNAPGAGLAGKLAALDPTQTADGTQLRYDGHTILLRGVSAETLDLDDFIFV